MSARWLAILFAVLTGCAGDARPPPAEPGPVAGISWPEPPDRVRIRYLYSFASHKDLGLKQPFFGRLRDTLSGAEATAMVRPYAVAVDNEAMVVADPGLSAVHLFDTRRRRYQVISRFGDRSLNSPIGVALAHERIFIADSVQNALFIMDRSANAVIAVENLDRPTALAWDAATEQLLVAETHAHRLRVFDRDGKQLMTLGARGEAPVQFSFPTHLAVNAGKIYLNDTLNFRVQILDINGSHIAVFGKQGDSAGYFAQPKGIAVDSQGNIYVAEAMNHRIQIFNGNGQYLMDFGERGAGPGEFAMPAGLAMFEDRLYVCDSRNGRIQVFEYLREE